jgi:hypothetical protein
MSCDFNVLQLAAGLLHPRLGIVNMRWAMALGSVVMWGGVAAAHAIADDVTVGASQTTAANPRAGYLAERLAVSLDLHRAWTLRVDGTWTYDAATAPSGDAHFGSQGGDVFLFSGNLTWTPSDRFWLSLEASGSPPSTTATDTTVAFSATRTGATTDVDADLRSRSSSIGGALTAGFDTAGESNAETALDLSAGFLHYETLQRIVEVVDRSGTVLPTSSLVTYCETHLCGKPLRSALQAQEAMLNQVRLGANVTETIYRTTDLGVSAALYLYKEDPTQVGYFGVTSVGRSSSFGSGMPIAPYRFTVSPDVAHRFGNLLCELGFLYGLYASDQGYALGATLRMQYRLSPRWKVWVKASGERDQDAEDATTLSSSVSLGARFTF